MFFKQETKTRILQKLRATGAKWVANHWPCLRRTGGRVIYLADDFTHLTVQLKFGWQTRNIVGTMFGGSLYSSTDPYYMLMLMEILGKDYVVWDKGCSFRFRRPARETIYADFQITPAMLEKVKSDVEKENEITFAWPLEYKNKAGDVFATFEKILYVAKREFYEQKQKRRELKSSGSAETIAAAIPPHPHPHPHPQ